jgi:glutaminyl-peptide cyclotransferase
MNQFAQLTATLLATIASVVHAQPAPVSPCKVIAKLPHSTANYTEGFFYRDGYFYEGTGREGHSSVIVTEPSTGKILQQHDLPGQYFGEGIIDWRDNLLEWTWQTHTGFIYDRASLRIIGQFHYDGEGWGMARTATELITSDGSAILRFRNPETFDQTRQIVVRDDGAPVRDLNELEFINGEIYANVWHSDRIARISPQDGRVLGWLECSGLLPANQKVDGESVLNGIAYDEQHHKLFVTGKQWPNVFQIQLPLLSSTTTRQNTSTKTHNPNKPNSSHPSK